MRQLAGFMGFSCHSAIIILGERKHFFAELGSTCLSSMESIERKQESGLLIKADETLTAFAIDFSVIPLSKCLGTCR